MGLVITIAACVVSVLLVAWAAFDSGFDLGWRYHSEDRANYKLWDVLRNRD